MLPIVPEVISFFLLALSVEVDWASRGQDDLIPESECLHTRRMGKSYSRVSAGALASAMRPHRQQGSRLSRAGVALRGSKHREPPAKRRPGPGFFLRTNESSSGLSPARRRSGFRPRMKALLAPSLPARRPPWPDDLSCLFPSPAPRARRADARGGKRLPPSPPPEPLGLGQSRPGESASPCRGAKRSQEWSGTSRTCQQGGRPAAKACVVAHKHSPPARIKQGHGSAVTRAPWGGLAERGFPPCCAGPGLEGTGCGSAGSRGPQPRRWLIPAASARARSPELCRAGRPWEP